MLPENVWGLRDQECQEHAQAKCQHVCHLRVQVNACPLHVPFAWHLLTADPLDLYPFSHAKLITLL